MNMPRRIPIIDCPFNTPLKFWIYKEKNKDNLNEIENKMFLIKPKKKLCSISPEVLCSAWNNNKFCRAILAKVISHDQSLLYFIDYGIETIVENKNIYEFPLKMLNYPAQAICCKLSNSEIEYTPEDKEYFHQLTSGKCLTATLISFDNEINEICLLNENGIDISSLLLIKKQENIQPSLNNDYCFPEIPSVCSKLVNKTEAFLVSVISDQDKMWAIITSSDSDTQDIIELQRLLNSLNTEEINDKVEERGCAAAYSPQFNEFYRCIILKRKETSFLVHYIDYGNQEEVTRICSLTPKLLSMCCYVVYCERPRNLSKEIFNNYFSNNVSVLVESVTKDLLKISFHYEKVQYHMNCYPWFHNLIFNKINKASCLNNSMHINIDKETKINNQIKLNHIRKLKTQKLINNEISQVMICYIDESKAYFHQIKDLENIKIMSQKLQILVSEFVSHNPCNDEILCGYFEEDQSWYRINVHEQINDDQYVVKFIDYGNIATISKKQMRILPDEFLNLPVYCIPVLISNRDKLIEKFNFNSIYQVEVIGEKDGIQIINIIMPIDNSRRIYYLDKFAKHSFINKHEIDVVIWFEENEIYSAQLFSELETINEMQTILLQNDQSLSNDHVYINEVLSAKSSDGSWYRGSVKEILSHDLVKIFFIDYGNTENISISNLKYLPDELAHIPIFRIPLKIKNKKCVEIGVQITIKIINNSQYEEIPFVEILKPNSDLPTIMSLQKQYLPDISISDIMICYIKNDIFFCHKEYDLDNLFKLRETLKLIKKEDLLMFPNVHDLVCVKNSLDEWCRGCVVDIIDENVCSIYFVDYGNVESFTFKDIKKFPSELCTFPTYAIPLKFYDSKCSYLVGDMLSVKVNGMCNDIQNVYIPQSIQKVVVLKLNFANQFSRLFKIQTLPINNNIEIIISFREDKLFYIQKLCDLEALTDMSKKLQLFNEEHQLNHVPRIGEILRVKYHNDGCWYRGVVKEICNDQQFKVFFLDYGNTENVALTEILSLPEELASLLSFCIPVNINNLLSINEPLQFEKVYTVHVLETTSDNIQCVDIVQNIKKTYLSSLKPFVIMDSIILDVKFHYMENEFYFLHYNKDELQIKEMNHVLENLTNLNSITSLPSIDEVLCAKYDDIFYRVAIKEILSDNQKCKAYFIDNGKSEIIPIQELYYLPKELLAFPIFCSKVILDKTDILKEPIVLNKLYNIYFTEKFNNDIKIIKIYRPYMISTFQQQKLKLYMKSKVVFFHKTDDKYFLQQFSDFEFISELSVKLQEFTAGKGILYSPKIGEVFCSKFTDNNWYRVCVKNILPNDQYLIHFIDYGNTAIVSKENLELLSDSLTQYPIFGIPVMINDQSININFEEIYEVIASDELNDAQLITFSTENDKNISLSNGEIRQINQSERKFMHDNLFDYAAFSSGRQNIIIRNVLVYPHIFCSSSNISVKEEIYQLVEEMTDFYGKLPCKSYNGPKPLEEGEIIAAKHLNKWYRALITHVNSPYYSMHFLDFGNSAHLHEDDLRTLENHFLKTKISTYFCTLIGFDVKKENIDQVNEELKSFVSSDLQAIVFQNEEATLIEIPSITEYLRKKELITS